MRKTEEDQGAKLVRAVICVLVGGVLSLAVCILFLAICSFGISGGWLREGLMYQLTIVGCVVGSFAGGLAAVRRYGSRGLIVGLAVGAVFFLLILTAGTLLFQDISLEGGGIGLLCGALCGGAAAGILGGSRRPKNRKKRGRH